MQTIACTHVHKRTHTHTYTCAQTHTHTHTQCTHTSACAMYIEHTFNTINAYNILIVLHCNMLMQHAELCLIYRIGWPS